MARFELRTGRFGSYFYDTANHQDVDLPTVLRYLNAYADYMAADVQEMIHGIEALNTSSIMLEKAAAQQHAIWAHWMSYFLSKMYKLSYRDSEGFIGYNILRSDIDRWRHQMITSYADLSEAEKEADRQIVRQFILGEKKVA